MNKKAVIGITLDWEKIGKYSNYCDWYAIRDNYVSSFAKFGGCCILLPYDQESIGNYLDLIDGLVITGGDYDIDPSEYREDIDLKQTRKLKNNRYEFEKNLYMHAKARKMPILGICAGEQLIAVVEGGSLLQDIKDSGFKDIEHEQRNLDLHPSRAAHLIELEKSSLLYEICKVEKFMVNSTHHQAVKSVSNSMIISARATDGIIEAIELKDYPFCLGIEWHPEYLTGEYDAKIIEFMIKQAQIYRKTRKK